MATTIKKAPNSLSTFWKFLIGLATIVSCLATLILIPEVRERMQGIFRGKWVPLESMGISTSVYSGESDPTLGSSKADLSTIDRNGSKEYWFDYELPAEDNSAKAGLEFKFLTLQDLSQYEYIKFTIDFVSSNAQVGFYFENANEDGKGDSKTLSKTAKLDGATIVNEENEKYTFQIPLDTFDDTNMKNVSEFGFYVFNQLATGKGKFMVTNIQFGKP